MRLSKLLLTWNLFHVFQCFTLAQQFQYPTPPDSLTNRQERTVFMAENFWDKESVGDSLNFKTPTLLLDYIYLIRQIENDDLQHSSITNFISLCAENPSTICLVLYWLDSILYDAHSPQYDEPIYLMFLNEVLKSCIESDIKIFPAKRVKQLYKNQKGKPANNFSVYDKKGSKFSLNDVQSPLILLIFNNPECSLCQIAEEEIQKDEIIQDLINNDSLKIVAVSPDADYATWLAHDYPNNWIVGIDKKRKIFRRQLFDIQYLPSMYLLDNEKKIVIKEADYDRIKNYFRHAYPSVKKCF